MIKIAFLYAITLASARDVVAPTHISEESLSRYGDDLYERSRHLIQENKESLDGMRAHLYCSVDASGVSECMSFDQLKELGREVDIVTEQLKAAYAEFGLDRSANVLLRCGPNWATANVDVGAVLQSFGGDAAAIAKIGARAADAPLYVPGSAIVPEFGAACGGSGGGGGASSDGRDPQVGPSGEADVDQAPEQSDVDQLKERMQHGIDEACAADDASSMFAAGTGQVLEQVHETVDSVNTLYDLRQKIEAEQTRQSTVQAGYDRPPPHKEGDVTITDKVIVTVEVTREDGKTARYVYGEWTKRDASGNSIGGGNVEVCRTSAGQRCSAEDLAVARAETQNQKTVAANAKKEDDERKKEEAARPKFGHAPVLKSCNPMLGRGCVDKCTEMQNMWDSISSMCDASGWQEYRCQRLLYMRCNDPAIIYPGPDGNVKCVMPDENTDTAMRRDACERNRGIMMCIDGACSCNVERFRPPNVREGMCDPRNCDPTR